MVEEHRYNPCAEVDLQYNGRCNIQEISLLDYIISKIDADDDG